MIQLPNFVSQITSGAGQLGILVMGSSIVVTQISIFVIAIASGGTQLAIVVMQSKTRAKLGSAKDMLPWLGVLTP